MDDSLKNFEKRHRDIRRKHRRLARGYVTRLQPNGTIVHEPSRDVSGVVAWPLMLLVATFFGFKALLLAQLGAETYASHLATLSQGNFAEQAGAVIMGADPLTRAIIAIAGAIV
ncbi:hypothetical protein [Roseivivax isoporae]|uniref:Uncharacterized protein n=1 Tax=Roseivivax isoporae LMG 25204 TaxID=1449351 RepID=X7FAV1_9RHOB|nr:hypothetical protein [Roseivivax isoporae]ETX29853.1 hypothetical protein RISW2_19535 [Roseivivax isoporae LMG 25204]